MFTQLLISPSTSKNTLTFCNSLGIFLKHTSSLRGETISSIKLKDKWKEALLLDFNNRVEGFLKSVYGGKITDTRSFLYLAQEKIKLHTWTKSFLAVKLSMPASGCAYSRVQRILKGLQRCRDIQKIRGIS